MQRVTLLLVTLAFQIGSASGKPTLDSFGDPQKCIQIPLKYGLQRADGDPPRWSFLEGLGWASQTEAITHKGQYLKVGDVNNSITCYFSSEKEGEIECVRITANCFNPEGETATIEKFKSLVEGLLADLGVEESNSVLKAVDPKQGKRIQTDNYSINIERQSYNLGYGWQLTLTTK